MRIAHDIAIELEHMLCQEFGFVERPIGTIFDADSIETYMFCDLMYLLLYKKSNHDWDEFANETYKFRGTNMNEIINYEAIFKKFKLLIE